MGSTPKRARTSVPCALRTRATLALDPLVRYEGAVDARGVRSGRGTLVVTDEEDGSQSWIAGEWADDELHGRATYTAADGSTVHGVYTRGCLSGRVLELEANGSIRYVGEYADGARGGYGLELRADGGVLEGTWASGVLHGTHCAYHYPCPNGGALLGEWRDGAMLRARYAQLLASATDDDVAPAAETGASVAPVAGGRACHITLPLATRLNPVASARALALARGEAVRALPRAPVRGPSFSHGPGARAALPAAPGVADAYEASRVAVWPSSIAGAGLGLWALRELRCGEVAAFYAGARVSRDAADAARAAPRSHALVLDEDEALDVPSEALLELADCAPAPARAPPAARYLASRGHYANHSFSSNCEYLPFEHPRFGAIVCVRVRADAVVRAGAELTVDYPLHAEHALPPDDGGGGAGARGGLPLWFAAYGARRDEDGYYFHLRMTPPRTLAAWPAGADGAGPVSALAHGPWRVLYLGKVEQGMSYVPQGGGGDGGDGGGGGGDGGDDAPCAAEVVGFEYVRTAAAAALALGELWRRPVAGAPPAAVLAIGLGAGTLPLFCKHHCPWLRVRAVELHARVAHVAVEHLRARARVLRAADAGAADAEHPTHFAVELNDGAAMLRRLAAERGGCAAAVLLDAYDGHGRVPEHLQREPFLRDCAHVLRERGVLVANVWNGERDSPRWARMAAFARAAEAAIGGVFAIAVRGQEANLVLVAVRGAPAGTRAAGEVSALVTLAAQALAHARAGAAPAYAPEVIEILERLATDARAPQQEIVPLHQLLTGSHRWLAAPAVPSEPMTASPR